MKINKFRLEIEIIGNYKDSIKTIKEIESKINFLMGCKVSKVFERSYI